MTLSGSVFSQTLQIVTTAKLEELAEQRLGFDKRYKHLLEETSKLPNTLHRLCALLEGVKTCFGLVTTSSKDGSASNTAAGLSDKPPLEIDLANLGRFLEQAKYDPSVSAKVLGNWERLLLQHLENQSTKYQYADLYGRLVSEWLVSERSANTKSDIVSSDSFEELPNAKKLEARAEWERVVFEPAQVDVEMLQHYLQQLFIPTLEDGESDSEEALKELRHQTGVFERSLTGLHQLQVSDLKWVIRGLQSSDLLSNEKREVLKDFLGNDMVLREITDVMNMRMAALDRWSWGDHVSLEQRRKVNGGYSIDMHEDLLQAIFLHFIGVKWSVFFKSALKTFRGAAWKATRIVNPKIDRLRREYYLGRDSTSNDSNLQDVRESTHRSSYFAYKLLDNECQTIETQDGEEEAEPKKHGAPVHTLPSTMPRTSFSRGSRSAAHRLSSSTPGPMGSFSASKPEPIKPKKSHSKKNFMEAQQELLHIVATEIVLNTHLYDEFACLRSVFESWDALLPHDTIMTVLRFFGVSERWLAFFKKFLQAPLKFDEDIGFSPRLRRRGTPRSHALSDVFGEVVLACLDYSVHQSTDGGLLYRLHDDIWFWSKDPEKCEKAWSTILEFTTAMNVQVDPKKTGSIHLSGEKTRAKKNVGDRLPSGDIRWGFLYLNPDTGRFDIDDVMVNGQIEELRGQLKEKSKSIIGWIQAWNIFVDTFLSSNFGKPANCFGREHVDQLLTTHRRIQERILNGRNVDQFLKQTIEERFEVKDIPEGFIYFPVELGGLDLKSPFISVLQIRESVKGNPGDFLDDYKERERTDYHHCKLCFERGDYKGSRHQREDIGFRSDEDANTFLTFEEFVQHREEWASTGTANVCRVYKDLLMRPTECSIDVSAQVGQALDQLKGQSNLKGITCDWKDMEPYWKWVAQMYGPEMCDRFGGLNIIDPGLLPIGMISVFRERRIMWQD